ncbi:MAG: Nif3-like dinuclear metal center hexameric protein [Coriobacteriia bacterium]
MNRNDGRRHVIVGAMVAHLDGQFPPEWAEPWDRIGLIAGDPSRDLSGVLVTLDPTLEAIGRAADLGCEMLVTHHPVLTEMPATLTPGTGPSGALFIALSRGVALYAAHTNADRHPDGSDVLPLAAGLEPGEPLEEDMQSMSLVTTFCPEASADSVAAAMAGAGAGRLGRYHGCSFAVAGEGRYTPGPGTRSSSGMTGEQTRAPEQRIEAVCPAHAVAAVVAAARASHPYEEPLIAVADAAVARGVARMGRLCAAPAGTTLASFARGAGKRLGVTPRVWGDPRRPVRKVATANGSGRGLVRAALAAGADTMLTGELRYHDALSALESGLAVVEAGHDATEWPIVDVLAKAVRSCPDGAGITVHVDEPAVRWWTP